MVTRSFPTLDLKATGANIAALRKAKGYSVRDLQKFFGFEQPQAIYKWQWGQTLPSVDNLYALSVLFDTPINAILVSTEQSADFFMPANSLFFIPMTPNPFRRKKPLKKYGPLLGVLFEGLYF